MGLNPALSHRPELSGPLEMLPFLEQGPRSLHTGRSTSTLGTSHWMVWSSLPSFLILGM